MKPPEPLSAVQIKHGSRGSAGHGRWTRRAPEGGAETQPTGNGHEAPPTSRREGAIGASSRPDSPPHHRPSPHARTPPPARSRRPGSAASRWQAAERVGIRWSPSCSWVIAFRPTAMSSGPSPSISSISRSGNQGDGNIRRGRSSTLLAANLLGSNGQRPQECQGRLSQHEPYNCPRAEPTTNHPPNAQKDEKPTFSRMMQSVSERSFPHRPLRTGD
jgi:hypothetical protein